MSRLWRQNKEKNRRVQQAREQLAIVQEAILALHEALQGCDKDAQQLLALTTRLDALLRRQDRLQGVLERAQDPQQAGQQESAKPPAIANAKLTAELIRRGLLPAATAENGPQES